jgi:Mg-chelatase subunit ChlD
MKRTFRTRVGVLLLILILVIMTGLAGCKPKPKETAETLPTNAPTTVAEDGWQGFILGNERVTPVWSFPGKATQPWSEVEPYINPMGEESAYTSYEYLEDESLFYQGFDLGMSAFERHFYGEVYKLTVPHRESLTLEQNGRFVDDIAVYVEAKKGEIIARGDGSILFSLIDPEGARWWCAASDDGSQIALDILKERELKVGQPFILQTEGLESPFYIASYQDGAHLYALDVAIDSGEASIAIEAQNQYADYRRTVSQRFDLSEEISLNYSFGDVACEPGLWLWEVSWYDGYEPSEIQLTLKAPLAMEKVTYGEALGAIKVSAAYASHLKAKPTGTAHVYLSHPEFQEESQYLDRTPDGDYLLSLPAGYWDVEIYPDGVPLLEFYQILAVPVHAGKVTEVTVPYGVASRLGAKAMAVDARGIDIGQLAENETDNTVSFDFTLLDRTTSAVEPTIQNTTITEGGRETKLLKIDPVVTPPNIVLLLDSSGSMKGTFQGVMEAAQGFIQGLPADAVVQVVDFDSTVKVLKGTTKTEALAALKNMRVDGDTALYNGLIQSLTLLEEAQRPMVVLFTDGENDLPGRTTASKAEALTALAKSEIPVFAIGFGKGHDSGTLTEIGAQSHGKYFSALDQNVLKSVFAAIQERIGSTYRAVYERPKEASLGDIPVVTFMVDNSGSMGDVDPGIGERMRILKNLLHPFVYGLPEAVQVQLMGFSDYTFGFQSLTTDKDRLIRAIDYLVADGGTNIPLAVRGAIESLRGLPSTKKVLIFITDAALNPDEAGMPELFKALKDERIRVLWVGMGLGEEVEVPFKKAAELSGGRYVISSDPIVLKKAFDEVLNLALAGPASKLSQLAIEVEKENTQGERETFGTSALVDLSPVKASGDVFSAEGVRHKVLGPLAQYDAKMAELITGKSIPGMASVITKRATIGKSHRGETVVIDAKELIFLSSLGGVEAPSGYRFMAMDLALTNVMKEQEVTVYEDGSGHPANWIAGGDAVEVVKMVPSYLIPDFSAHFFVSFNGKGSFAASTSTWLAERPLVNPGDKALLLEPKRETGGVLVFLVPDEPIQQLSLHLYDVAYGSVHMPLIGKMPPQQALVAQLSQEVGVNLAAGFDLQFVSLVDGAPIGAAYPPREGNVLRQVDGIFKSNVQALLDVDPVERMRLEILSASGSYYIPLHPVTTLVPLGQYHAKMIGPGAMNLTRWLFEFPAALKALPANLYVNLAGKDARLQVLQGTAAVGGQGQRFKGDDFDATINGAIRLEDGIGDLVAGKLILDVTLHDHEDGYSTQDIGQAFQVTSTTAEGVVEEAEISRLSDSLLLGFGTETIVFDGTSHRGYLVFDNPKPEEALDWRVTSPFFEGLSVPFVSAAGERSLLTFKMDFERDETYETALSQALSARIAQFEAERALETERSKQGAVALNGASGADVSIPPMGLSGLKQIDAVKSQADVRKLLKSLRFLPTKRSLAPFESLYSPEATLTQGFGTENDYAALAMTLYAKLGMKPKPKAITLTEKGKQALERFSGGVPFTDDTVPGVYFEDATGPHILVLPFVEYLEDMSGLARYGDQQAIEPASDTIVMTVEVNGYDLIADRTETVGDMGDALAGDTEGGPRRTSIEIFNETLDLNTLSRDAIDLGFAKKGLSIKGFLLMDGKPKISQEGVWAKAFDAKSVTVTLETGADMPLKHTVTLDGGRTLEDIFMTLSVNAPELPKAAGELLQTERQDLVKAVDQVTDLAALRGYTRSRIQEFIKAQSAFEREVAESLDLVIGNTNNPRAVVMTLKAPKVPGKLEASISLMDAISDVHFGEEDQVAAFNMMSGLNATALEDAVLGEKGVGSLDIIAAAPKGSSLILMTARLNDQNIDALTNAGMPMSLIDYFGSCPNHILIPDKPSKIGGITRWAWIEINPETYETIGVMDSLEKGAMVESVIVDTVKSAGQYAVGNFVGVNSSIWAVAGVSLKEDDYKTILKEAKAIALGIKDSFGIKSGPASGSVGGKLEISQTFGPVKVGFDGGVIFTQDVLGFTQGYEDGVKAYFEAAQ